MRPVVLILSLLTLLGFSGLALGADDSIAAAEKVCPGFSSWLQAQEVAHKKELASQKDKGNLKPTLPVLREELLKMSAQDQADRNAYFGSQQKDTQALVKMQHDDAADLKRMQAIVDKYGFPTPAMVGADGVDAAWLLVQHADADTAFQAKVLGLIKPLLDKDEISKQDFALLTDRVLLAQGKAQRYGSQLSIGELTAQRSISLREPVEDPKNLDKRRAEMDLMPLPIYICINKVMYGITD